MNQPAQETLRRIPLHALHAGYGAKFGAFAGHEMPIQYPAGLKAEHLHTRERASLFDVSHMGQLRIRADDERPQTSSTRPRARRRRSNCSRTTSTPVAAATRP